METLELQKNRRSPHIPLPSLNSFTEKWAHMNDIDTASSGYASTYRSITTAGSNPASFDVDSTFAPSFSKAKGSMSKSLGRKIKGGHQQYLNHQPTKKQIIDVEVLSASVASSNQYNHNYFPSGYGFGNGEDGDERLHSEESLAGLMEEGEGGAETSGLLSWDLLNEIRLEDQFDKWKITELHRRIIPTRKGVSTSSAAYFWTKRSTSTDIMSTVTTTIPVGDGRLMEDLAPTKLTEPTVIQKPLIPHKGPLDCGVNQNGMTAEERERVNQGLWLEHSIFMEKLARKRKQRFNIENYAAIVVQSSFRRYLVKKRWPVIKACLKVRQEMQADFRSCLHNNKLLLTRKQLQEFQKEMRKSKATLIQSSVRRWLAYRTYERRLLHFIAEKRNLSATKIQCMIRIWRAKQWTKSLQRMLKLAKRDASIIIIQKAYRAALGRRKYRIYSQLLKQTAAIMIQCMYRQRMSIYRVKKVRQDKKMKAEYKGISGIQRITRGYLGRKRFIRIEKEKLDAKLKQSAFTIQTHYRAHVARKKVIVRSIRRKQFNTLVAILTVQRIIRGFLGRKRMEKVRLWLSINISHQIKIGDLEGVEDVYEGYDTDEPLSPTYKDASGNTLLHIAAKYNQLSIVRKCIGWGVDSNTRNNNNETPLQVALSSAALQVSQYLLSKIGSTILTEKKTTGEGLLQAAAAGAMHQCLLNLMNMGFEPTKDISIHTGKSALHSACEAGNTEMCIFLLNRTVEPGEGDDTTAWIEVQDKQGRNALHYASQASGKNKAMKEIVELLLAKTGRKNVAVTDQNGMTAKILALLAGNLEVANMLVESEEKTIYEALDYGQPIIWKNINSEEMIKTHHQYLGVLYSSVQDSKIMEEYTKALQYLLALGMPFYVISTSTSIKTNLTKSNILLDSAMLGLIPLVERCLTHPQFKGPSNQKKDVFKCDITGATWLHLLLAADKGTQTIDSSITIMANIDEEIKSVDKHGRYPLHIAASNGHPVRAFVFKDDALSKTDNYGCTALYLAAHSLQIEALNELITLDPKEATQINTKTGFTPLEACCTSSLSIESLGSSSTGRRSQSLLQMLSYTKHAYNTNSSLPAMISSDDFNMNKNISNTSILSDYVKRGEDCMQLLLSTCETIGLDACKLIGTTSSIGPLFLIGYSGNLGAIKVVLEKVKSDDCIYEDIQREILYTCIEYGHMHCIKYLLDSFPELINPGQSSLPFSSQDNKSNGYASDVDSVGSKGGENNNKKGAMYDASVTTIPLSSAIRPNRLLYSPLAIAIIHRQANKEMIDYFISKGLISKYDREGGIEDRNIFHIIAQYGSEMEFEYMLDIIYPNHGSTEKTTTFSTTAYLTQFNSKYPLLEQRDIYGLTPLIQATLTKNNKIVDFLMKKLAFKNANTNVYNFNLKENRQLQNYRLIQNFGTIGWFNGWVKSEEEFLNRVAATRRGSAEKS